MRQFDVRELNGNSCGYFSPKSRTIQHIRFVHRSHLAAAAPRQFKSHASYSFDFRLAVAHSINSNALSKVSCRIAWFTKIKTAKQLTNKKNVSSTDDFRAQRRTIF